MRHRSRCASARLAVAAILIAAAATSVAPHIATAATNDQKIVAIDAGLEYLAQHQYPDGHWIYGTGNADDDAAATGLALQSFMLAGYMPGADVIIDGTNYGDVVGLGLNYVLNRGYRIPITNQMHGNPDTNGNGYGVKFVPAGSDLAVDDAQHTVEANGMTWTFDAAAVDQFVLDGAGGADQVELHDTHGNDSVKAVGPTAELFSTNYRLGAIAFELVRAISESGGDDTAEEEAADFVFQLEGAWDLV